MTLLAKLKAAGAWIVRNWKWFLFPLGVLFWFAGKASGKTTVQVKSSELEGHRQLEWELAEKTDARIEEAKVAKAEETDAINLDYSRKVKELNAQEKLTADSLQKNPDALNDFLKGVGREHRKPRV